MPDDFQPPNRPVTPTPPPLAGPNTYAPSPLPNYTANLPAFSAAIEHHESGGRNVVSPAGAVGPRQIMPGTFKQFALPGESINNPADNRAVGDRILAHYLQVYHGDAQRAAVAYFSGPGNVAPPGSATPWIRNTGDGNNTVSQYVAATAGRMGAPASAPNPTTPGAQPAPAPAPAPPTAPPAPPLTVGGALAALSSPTGPDGKGLSPLDQASKAFGGGQDQKAPQAPPSPPLELQQMAFQGRQQQLAQQGAALAAALRAQGAQPLTWGTRPFGSNAGPQDAPGMTLNSMGSPDGV